MTSHPVPFEGPEKKLEIILSRPVADLRDNIDGRWEKVVADSHAQVISHMADDHMDAYLLSESSLFIWPDRVLMITCGRTTLVRSLERLCRIIGRDRVGIVFYEQKNFLYPDAQPSDFEADARRLSSFFPGVISRLGPADDDHVNLFTAGVCPVEPAPDVTFQMLMHDLDPSVQSQFRTDALHHQSHERLLAEISGLCGDMRVDDYLFEPEGYSLNAIGGGHYLTIHVTPQDTGSYTSVETNLQKADYARLVGEIAAVFRPSRYSLVLTTSLDSECRRQHRALEADGGLYRCRHHCSEDIACGYAVTFAHYDKG